MEEEDVPDPAVAELERLHSTEAIQARLEQGPRESYLRDWVYGAVDGTVTTFAVVAGVSGAELDPTIVIVLGFANLFGDGFSMAAGNYLGTRSELAQRRRQVEIERQHIRLHPQGEREEVRQIFARKGFDGAELESIVDTITADHERWIDTMMQEEHGIARSGRSPLRAAASTFCAFLLVGFVPLLVYVWDALVSPEAHVARLFWWSSILTGLAFFGVGALKSRFVGERWWVSGLETTAVGGAAATIAYAVGALVRGLL